MNFGTVVVSLLPVPPGTSLTDTDKIKQQGTWGMNNIDTQPSYSLQLQLHSLDEP